ncbi:DUF2975 domain-containing protein [Boseongicola sp. H5]|uniref:DUF2975 domain-containing protein n=1 Tax=Rhodobacterales TaxID=204455 RepID=UPI001B2772BA|nr:DUF2975 domain-containing protein [Boseongicola sp. H5]MBO6625483.1 DUF2975 domain-containing protein [Roseicyclus sp.]MBO6923475.1 DUF2975 domain-containing protein [Roseicyclus sp.]
MTNRDLNHIISMARLLHLASTIGLIFLPVAVGLAFVIGEAGIDDLRETYAEHTLPEVIGTGSYLSILVIQSVGLLLTFYVLWQMRGLFAYYKSGETLTARCAGQILRIGKGLVAIGVIGILSNTLIVLILTWGNPVGQRVLSVGFNDGDVGFILAGGLIVVIGWVMREAALVAEENRGFI